MTDVSLSGFYEVAGQRYISKFQAFEAALPNGWLPHWNYHEHAFDQYNWEQEPTESIEELYAQRARELRDRYDRVILWYSGGSDSHTIARTFIDNHIHIDEIWHRTSVDRWSRTDANKDPENQPNESRFTAIPQLKQIQEDAPNTTVKIFDAMDYAIDQWRTGLVRPDEMTFFSPLLHSKVHSDLFNTSSANRTVKICGIDKPRVFKENGAWYFAFLDISLNDQIMHNRARPDSSEEDACFFWDPVAANIIIKQCHMIIRWFEAHPEMDHLTVKNISHEDRHLRDEIIKSIIYPKWDLNTWQVAKPRTKVAYPEFHWFYQNNSDLAVRNFKDSLRWYSEEVNILRKTSSLSTANELITQQDGYWMFPGCWSKLYHLKQVDQ